VIYRKLLFSNYVNIFYKQLMHINQNLKVGPPASVVCLYTEQMSRHTDSVCSKGCIHTHQSHTHVRTHTQSHACTYTHTSHTRMYVHTQSHACTYTHTVTRMYIHTQSHACTYTPVTHACMYTHTSHTRTYVHTQYTQHTHLPSVVWEKYSVIIEIRAAVFSC
jgi:hypothetical protein